MFFFKKNTFENPLREPVNVRTRSWYLNTLKKTRQNFLSCHKENPAQKILCLKRQKILSCFEPYPNAWVKRVSFCGGHKTGGPFGVFRRAVVRRGYAAVNTTHFKKKNIDLFIVFKTYLRVEKVVFLHLSAVLRHSLCCTLSPTLRCQCNPR